MDILLNVKNLSVNFPLRDYTVHAVRDVSFFIEEGKTLGLVGESGCGKSVTAFSLPGLITPPGKIVSGEIVYRGRNIAGLENEEMRKIRGREISMIFQEPMTSLNPVFSIGYQISESLILHLGKSKPEAKEMALDLLDQVGIPGASRRYSSYPHEFSGGMRQRVMIAMALAASPSLLIADEPTTALDVTIQAQILDLLLKIQDERRMSLLLITHDLGVVANIADSIAIMYAGEIVEEGDTREVFRKPMHPYTLGLFDSIPRIGEVKERLNTIPGTVPTVTEKPGACIFHPRCPLGSEECLMEAVPLRSIAGKRQVRCIKAGVPVES